jgi:hypothetical protein
MSVVKVMAVARQATSVSHRVAVPNKSVALVAAPGGLIDNSGIIETGDQ